MNDENCRKRKNNGIIRASKDCAYLAVFVALVIVAQLCLAVIPGIELITLLFVSYAFAFGARRGMLAATAFSLLRQLIFGFFPVVLVLYLIYYNFLTAFFGFLGKRVKRVVSALWWLIALACLCTALFTLLDCVITPFWYGYSRAATKGYFVAALPFMLPQIACTACTVGVLFLPLQSLFGKIAKNLR